jgi:KDO2-lipid IV(A) lauroyltransferase
MFAFVVYKLGARLAQSLSLPTARKLAHVVGRLMCFLQRRNRRHLLRNLEVAFGDELTPRELRRLRRRIFCNFAVFVTDFLRMPLVTESNLGDYFTPGSLERVRRLGEMATPETPVISTTAHLGNWEMGAAATGLLAGPISVLVDVHPSGLVTAFFDGRRADKGIDVVSVSAFHKCFRALRKGSLVAIVGDRPVTGQGIRIEYFGREALLPDGYAVLARRFGASVVPTFMLMNEDGKYEFVVDDPVSPRVTDDVTADVRDLAERCVKVFEAYIRRYPEQWYVFRPVWDGKTAAVEDRHRRRGRRLMTRRGRASKRRGR